MAATSDTHPEMGQSTEYDHAKALRETIKNSSGVNHAGRIFFGSALSISAFGLWLVPVDPGDSAMQLIKLLVSVVMLGLGAMFIFSARKSSDAPEIQIDTATREIRVLKRDSNDKPYVSACHAMDSLTDVTLKDRLLSARDETGQLIMSVPMPNKAAEAAVRSALQISG